jgi:hypothetical protein
VVGNRGVGNTAAAAERHDEEQLFAARPGAARRARERPLGASPKSAPGPPALQLLG